MCKNFPIVGVLNHLKETFTHTPSYDMSPAMLNVLVRMMLAQAQESVFEKICLPGIQNEFFMLVKVAQEAAKVSLPGSRDVQGAQDASVRATGSRGDVPPPLAHGLGSMPTPARVLACTLLASTSVSDMDRRLHLLLSLKPSIMTVA